MSGALRMWVSVTEAEAGQAQSTGTLAWAWTRGCLRLCRSRPADGPVVALDVLPAGLEALGRLAVPEDYEPDTFDSRAAHRLATRYASVLKCAGGFSVRRGAYDLLERNVVRVERVSGFVGG